MDDNRPGYYAIIPANVRYDEKLQASAKLLYGEISALLNEDGFCFASNAYFANLYGVTERTISGLISKLQQGGYVFIDIVRDDSGQVVSRKIRLTASVSDGQPVEKNFHTPRKDFREGIENNFQYTNTSNTNIYKENIKESSQPKESKSGKRGRKKAEPIDPLPLIVEWIRNDTSDDWSDDMRNELYLAVVRFLQGRQDAGIPLQSKPATTALCNRLMRYSGGQHAIMIDMLDTATERGWRSIYRPKDAGVQLDQTKQEDKRWL